MRTLPVSGSTATSQRSLLLAARACARSPARRHRTTAPSPTGWASPVLLVSSGATEPAPPPSVFPVSRFRIDQRAIVLRVADERARRDVLGVARLGDVVRHVGTLRRVRALDDEEEDVLAVRRELQVGGRLAIGELELRQRARLVLFLGLLLLLGLDPRVLDQLLLFRLDELLAVGVARIALARLHVGELRDLAAVERDEEQVVVAREGDRRLAARPARVGFVAGGAGDLAPRAGRSCRAARCRRDRRTGRAGAPRPSGR